MNTQKDAEAKQSFFFAILLLLSLLKKISLGPKNHEKVSNYFLSELWPLLLFRNVMSFSFLLFSNSFSFSVVQEMIFRRPTCNVSPSMIESILVEWKWNNFLQFLQQQPTEGNFSTQSQLFLSPLQITLSNQGFDHFYVSSRSNKVIAIKISSNNEKRDLLLKFDISFSKFIKSTVLRVNEIIWVEVLWLKYFLWVFFVVRKVLRLLKDITFFFRRGFFYLNDDWFLNLCQDIQNAKKWKIHQEWKTASSQGVKSRNRFFD